MPYEASERYRRIEFAGLLTRFGYEITRQAGSHLRLTSTLKGEHHLTIPRHKPLKVGTLSSIFNDVALHMEMTRDSLVKELFSK